MNAIEVETDAGWRNATAHVVALGGGRFRASVRLRAATLPTDANVRFEGRAIRGIVKTTVRDGRSGLDTVVIEFRNG
jgi:hypothetical protein